MTELPHGWRSYKTNDGKEYYYNTKTKVTTWTRPIAPNVMKSNKPPSVNPPAVPTSKPPVEAKGGGRGNLLAAIQQGKSLKKAVTRESTPLEVTATSSSRSSGNGMMDAIKGGQSMLKKTNGASNSPYQSPSLAPSASPSSGGFAEIMRKNREAAAKKTGTPPPSSSATGQSHVTAPFVARTHHGDGDRGVSTNVPMETRLANVEAKLDKLMAHFNII